MARYGLTRPVLPRYRPRMDTAAIRAQLDHPVIDADGHLVEFLPLIRDFLRRNKRLTLER